MTKTPRPQQTSRLVDPSHLTHSPRPGGAPLSHSPAPLHEPGLARQNSRVYQKISFIVTHKKQSRSTGLSVCTKCGGSKATWAAPISPIMLCPRAAPRSSVEGSPYPQCLFLRREAGGEAGGAAGCLRERQPSKADRALRGEGNPPELREPEPELLYPGVRSTCTRAVRAGHSATRVQQWRSTQGRMPRFSWWNSTSCSRSVKRVWPSSMLK